MTEVMITLSIEKDQLTLKNIAYVFLMYFTYSQMWIVLVVYSLFLEIKRVVRKEEHTWYKTERFPTERGK